MGMTPCQPELCMRAYPISLRPPYWPVAARGLGLFRGLAKRHWKSVVDVLTFDGRLCYQTGLNQSEACEPHFPPPIRQKVKRSAKRNAEWNTHAANKGETTSSSLSRGSEPDRFQRWTPGYH